jgi:hypothetical protein
VNSPDVQRAVVANGIRRLASENPAPTSATGSILEHILLLNAGSLRTSSISSWPTHGHVCGWLLRLICMVGIRIRLSKYLGMLEFPEEKTKVML